MKSALLKESFQMCLIGLLHPLRNENLSYTNVMNVPLVPSNNVQAHTAGIIRVEHSHLDIVANVISVLGGYIRQ